MRICRQARLLALLTFTALGCTKDLDEKLFVAQQELGRSKSEIDRLNAEVVQLRRENENLSLTEDGLWARATQSEQPGNEKQARALYQEFERRFPTSARLRLIATANERLNAMECAGLLATARKTIAGESREALTALVEAMARNSDYSVRCSAKKDLSDMEAVRKLAATTAAKWPEKMTIPAYIARHSDLQGKRARIVGTLRTNNLYIFGYRNAERLRSFALTSEHDFEHLNVYCERSPPCDALLSKVLAADDQLEGEWVIENAIRYYEPGAQAGLLILTEAP